ncbi:MAG: carbohydrate kinase family protein [Caldiserica bacterium]|nr:carbohydrate kinase family protein [Caldisericota bacterium]
MERGGERALVIGDLNVDVVARARGWPPPGEEVEAEWAELRCGGAGGNVAMWLAWLGIEVVLFARIGGDRWGESAVRELARVGVRTEFVQRDPDRGTGLVISLVDPAGERAMVAYPGASLALTDGLDDAMEGAAWVHISGYVARRRPEVARRALDRARGSGIPVSLDLNPLFTAGELPGLSPGDLTLVFGTERELPRPEAAHETFVKRGPNGCTWRRGRRAEDVPGFPVTVRDTTGSGDAFVAGVIAARLRGHGPRLQGLVGNLCGALRAAGHRPPDVPRGEVAALTGTAGLAPEERLAVRALLEGDDG